MKICVIGGGTAGWLAALWITKMQKGQHRVTVIESSKIKIIGAGEGTTGHFSGIIKNVIGNFGINEAEFMKETGATQKMGIRFSNWKGQGDSFISPIDNAPTLGESEWDLLMQYHCAYVDDQHPNRATMCGVLGEKGLSTYDRNHWESYGFCAYHFDGHKVGQYFKKIAAPLCEQVVDSEFLSASLDEQGYISSITLTNGQTIEADWFLDATGFARVLAPSVDAKWVSYKEWLTCDRAIPFLLPHKGRNVASLTDSVALSAGWMWKIPTQTRYGCGYVYDSSCISYDQALDELERFLGHRVEPIKHIEFEPGRLEETFCKNVVFIGLSGIFLEPLQATSIHGTISQLQCFHNLILRPDSAARSIHQNRRANEIMNRDFDQFADLIQTHYRSGRTDTEFWKKQQALPARPCVEYLKELGSRRWPHPFDWESGWGSAGYGVFIYVMLHYGWIDLDEIRPTVNPKIKAAYDRWQQKIKGVTDRVMSHDQMIESLLEDRIQKLVYQDNLPIATVAQNNSNKSLHPLLRV
jgi:flavin-dependent dehydrogenase